MHIVQLSLTHPNRATNLLLVVVTENRLTISVNRAVSWRLRGVRVCSQHVEQRRRREKNPKHDYCLRICNVRDAICGHKSPQNFPPAFGGRWVFFRKMDRLCHRMDRVSADRPMTPTHRGGLSEGGRGEGGPVKKQLGNRFLPKILPYVSVPDARPLLRTRGTRTHAGALPERTLRCQNYSVTIKNLLREVPRLALW